MKINLRARKDESSFDWDGKTIYAGDEPAGKDIATEWLKVANILIWSTLLLMFWYKFGAFIILKWFAGAFPNLMG